MPIVVRRLTRQHLASAGTLLAARHRRDRLALPTLPAALEDPSLAIAAVRAATIGVTSAGVVAIQDGQPAGYLIASRRTVPVDSVEALDFAPRSVVIERAGHAAEPDAALEVYGSLYAALAASWVRAGWNAHYVDVVASDHPALTAWRTLGFCLDSVFAIRAVDGRVGAGAGGSLRVRRAGPDDIETVLRLIRGLDRHHTTSPIFRPLPEGIGAARRREAASALRDPAAPHWLAERDGRAVGLVSMRADAPRWPAVADQQTAFLSLGYSEPDTRHAGVALLRHALAWARAHGYERCLTGWHAANLLSARFCLAVGFRPVLYRLCRRIDERSVAQQPTY